MPALGDQARAPHLAASRSPPPAAPCLGPVGWGDGTSRFQGAHPRHCTPDPPAAGCWAQHKADPVHGGDRLPGPLLEPRPRPGPARCPVAPGNREQNSLAAPARLISNYWKKKRRRPILSLPAHHPAPQEVAQFPPQPHSPWAGEGHRGGVLWDGTWGPVWRPEAGRVGRPGSSTGLNNADTCFSG